MRKLLGRGVRGFLWIIKGLLLLIAVGAAVMWPVSRGRQMAVIAERYAAGPESGEYRDYSAGCWDGRAFLVRQWQDPGGPGLAWFRAKALAGGEGWRWKRGSKASSWDEEAWPSRWGPLRCDFFDLNNPGVTFHGRTIAAPLWLVALAAGAWPLASITLLIRRRRKRRRLALVGCCQQ